MNPKYAKKQGGFAGILVLVVIALVATGAYYLGRITHQPSMAQRSTTTPVDLYNGQSPKLIVETFCENFFKSAPPNPDKKATEKANSFLSKRAQDLVKQSPNITSGLARLAGVQNTPQGNTCTVDEVKKVGNIVVVSTTWNYSEPSPFTFYLIDEDNALKINSISNSNKP